MGRGSIYGNPKNTKPSWYSYVSTGGNFEYAENRKKSKKGFYQVAFTKEYKGLSSRDIELKNEYGKDLVSKYTGCPKEVLHLQRKSEKTGLTAIDTVYYIKEGKYTIGKLAIREQQTFRDLGLIFIYLTKESKPKEAPSMNEQKKTRGQKRKNKRKQFVRGPQKGYTD